MGKPLAGEVVVLPFPQTNTRASERRSVGASERHASRSTLHASLFPLDLSLSVSATESKGNGFLSSETQTGRRPVLPYLHRPFGHRDPLALGNGGFLHE